ncbi:DUF3558 family protein [Actinopolyspora lacussalsi]|uniref:DUF3558 family protein n=1 Tax=Actinopolyspora righensis TaxID=995060 RepID=UPI000B89BB49|nr:DUF3558 family protein [Actinopolyspora righensis]
MILIQDRKFETLLGILCLVFVASGCSQSPAQDSPNSATESTEKTLLSNLSPCEALTQKQESKIEASGPGSPEEVVDVKACRWGLTSGNINISFYPEKTINDLDFSEGQVSGFKVGNKQGKLVKGNTEDLCTVAIPVNNNSESISVDAQGKGNTTSCDLAKKIAPMVEQNISDS